MCPRFTPLGEFTNNRAHSNMFYGLRIHPEFYPRVNPCNNGGDFGSLSDKTTFVQVWPHLGTSPGTLKCFGYQEILLDMILVQ